MSIVRRKRSPFGRYNAAHKMFANFLSFGVSLIAMPITPQFENIKVISGKPKRKRRTR
jgi:hypothetical protein